MLDLIDDEVRTRLTPYEAWRGRARRFLQAGVPPERADWDERSLLMQGADILPAEQPLPKVPAALVDLLERAACHRDPYRHALMYRLLWRVVYERKRLLVDAADDDVMMVTRLATAVDRASHKMKAFVRFREITTRGGPRYFARFTPEHDVLQRTAPFFVERFGTMVWAIVTPDGGVRWDGKSLSCFDVDRAGKHPPEDAAEALWLRYYESIFNPARLKQPARESTIQSVALGTMPTKALLDACRRCPLSQRATQGVPGNGPLRASLMLVGEQPGDEEDIAGKPFVGPAGKLLRRAMDDAGVDPERVYITNAVKHFSFEPRGQRRIHKTPAQREIEACRTWIDAEIAHVQPQIIVALGASALHSLLGKRIAVGGARDAKLTHVSRARIVATYHPSAVLRDADAAAKAARYEALVYDLRNARALAGLTAPA